MYKGFRSSVPGSRGRNQYIYIYIYIYFLFSYNCLHCRVAIRIKWANNTATSHKCYSELSKNTAEN